jgi:hypothetical protein
MLSSVNAIASLFIYCIYLMHGLHHILLDHYDYLMMQSCLWQMVCMRTTNDDVFDIAEGSAPHGRGCGQPSRGNAPLPPPHPLVNLEQLLPIQNELMTLLIQNEARRGAECPQHPRYQDMNTSYSEFLVTHPPLFSGERTRLRQTIGSALPSQSSAYLTVQSIKRLCMQLSNSEVQQGPGGHLTQPHFQQTIMCHGASSAPPSVATTCQRALCAISLQSFWICATETSLSTSIFRNSTIWHSTGVTMWILMRRRPSSFARGSLFSCRIV